MSRSSLTIVFVDGGRHERAPPEQRPDDQGQKDDRTGPQSSPHLVSLSCGLSDCRILLRARKAFLCFSVFLWLTDTSSHTLLPPCLPGIVRRASRGLGERVFDLFGALICEKYPRVQSEKGGCYYQWYLAYIFSRVSFLAQRQVRKSEHLTLQFLSTVKRVRMEAS